MTTDLDKNYFAVLHGLKDRIRQAKLRALLAVNRELLLIYWEIGKSILAQQEQEGWGAKVIDRLSADLRMEFPDMKGFSVRNIKYMRAFAEAYPHFGQQAAAQLHSADNEHIAIVQRTAAQLPWGHHQLLLDKAQSRKEREFYTIKTIENGWSRSVLAHQIESGLHKRQGALVNNFSSIMPAYQSELTAQIFKDPYNFDFIMLGEKAKERDLEDALMTHVTKVLLELGAGFALLGRQRKLEAGGREFFVDLLFYHTKLRRHIIIELKIGEFEPEFVSKMNLYLGLADDNLKGEHDESSIGIILCKTNNRVVAEYALRDTSKPIGIAEYKIEDLLPEEIRGELPSIEEIEQRMDEEIKEANSPVDNRLQAIKDRIKNINSEEIQTPATFALLSKLYKNGLRLLYTEMMQRFMAFQDDFHSVRFMWFGGSKNFEHLEAVDEFWAEETNLRAIIDFNFRIALDGLKKTGTRHFSPSQTVTLKMDTYHYRLALVDYTNDHPPLGKLYHQTLSKNDRSSISDWVMTAFLDQIEQFLESIDEI